MGEKKTFGLSKNERLHQVKLIDNLFKQALSFKAYPVIFSFKYSETPLDAPFSFIFTVSKKKFKRAVDRNRVRRLMKESLRLKKTQLIEALNGQYLYAAMIYTSTQLPELKDLETSVNKFIQMLHEKNRS
jgi:ribonuclease P protein component